MKIASVIMSVADGSVTFHFAGCAPEVFNVSELNDDIRATLVLHGLKQKLADRYAGVGSATEARDLVREVFANLKAGDWDKRGGTGAGIWVEAIARVTGKPVADVAKTWQAMDEKKRAEVRKNSKVKLAKVEIERERLAASADEGEELEF